MPLSKSDKGRGSGVSRVVLFLEVKEVAIRDNLLFALDLDVTR